MGDKYIGIKTDAQLYLANKTVEIPVWDGDMKLGTIRLGKTGLSWKVGKHETPKIAFENLQKRLEGTP
jgi:hypothetical protein